MKKLIAVSVVSVLVIAEDAAAKSTSGGSFEIAAGTVTTPQTLGANKKGIIDQGATLTSSSAITVTITGSATLTNNGTLSETGSSRAVRITGTGIDVNLNNAAGASITAAGDDTIQSKADASVNITNAGSITSGTTSTAGGQAIDLNNVVSKTNTITNLATGTITAYGSDALRPGANGTITNAGIIQAINSVDNTSGNDAIDAQTNSGVTISNSGTISSARHGITGGNTDVSTSGAYVMNITNQSGGTIIGNNGAGINIDGFNANEVVTINNSGTLSGNGITGDGDGVDVDGVVVLTNSSTGQIISTQANGDTSEGVTVGGGTIDNYGLIEGQNPGGASHGITLAGVDKDPTTGTAIPIEGIYTDSTIHNYSGGTIKGDTGSGIAITGGATTHTVTIDNDAGATIEGGGSDAAISTGVTTTTINNAGIIRANGSGKAVDFGTGANNVLSITGGNAQIIGDIDGGTGNSTLIINPGTGNRFSYGGAISGFSLIELGSGTIALSGTNNYSGSTRLTAGTLSLGSNSALGTSTLEMAANTTLSFASSGLTLANAISLDGDPTIDVASGTDTLAGTLSDGSAPGDLVKTGAGTLVLTGANTYTGGTEVADGTLQVDGSLTSAVTVDSSGTLSGVGQVGTTTVSGMLAPGDTGTGTLTVNGNLTLGSGSTYALNITPDTAQSLVSVTGTAALQGGTIDVTGTGSNWHNPVVLLQAGQGVSGTFGTLVTNLAYLSPILTYNADDVSLSFRRNGVAFTDVGITRNEAAAGSGLAALSSGTLYDALVTTSTTTARTALNTLSGEIHASARTALIQDSLYVRDAITERLRAADCMPGAGSGLKTAHISSTCHTDEAGVWMQGYGAFSHNRGDGNASALTDNAGGFMLGVDTPLAGWHIGVAAGYGHSSFSSGSVASWGHSDNVSIGPYAGTHWGRLGLRMGVTYTFDMLSTSRNVALPGYAARLNTSYNGGTTQAFGDLGYRLNMGPLWAEPFANVAWVNVHTGHFNERGNSEASLTGDAASAATTFATFGSRLAGQVRAGHLILTPQATLAYRHGFGTLRPTARQSFTGGNVFEVAGTPVTQDAALIKTGLQARLTDRIMISTDYVGQFSTGYTSNGVTGSLKISF
ncbi:autotransporter domain-containing protein [Acetobacter suratthaniensis]|uniref:Autotransporter domain-containing protein n=1 Tax=Acetobacter suratthaniensis TaxID=1502841 RepID=A0ABS3LJM3_9PROT|nr:autotransporter domain-containing protein [Acetobacter suratthaniensis]MBO1327784.1 autotransporter domain-containing protein [Acetobacter suratthaniensis]MCX2565766.1 autotransporter domain-containing protein [Acetobacter suratthaniensis]